MSVLEVARGARRKASECPVDVCQVLAGRLDTGWTMCESETDPTRKERLEEHWLRLLREYEAACDRAAAVGRTPQAVDRSHG